MSGIISLNQSAFVKERLLMENVLLTMELVKEYHKDSISANCAMKIDISKAFDSVQWSFILNTLSALNFMERFIHCIKLFISTSSFSVQFNGELTAKEGCVRAVLYLCMNVLSRMLDRVVVERKIGYHP